MFALALFLPARSTWRREMRENSLEFKNRQLSEQEAKLWSEVAKEPWAWDFTDLSCSGAGRLPVEFALLLCLLLLVWSDSGSFMSGVFFAAVLTFLFPLLKTVLGTTGNVLSFSETRAHQVVQQKSEQFMVYNQKQLTRIYPSAYRIDSSNFNPLPYWNAGCQLGVYTSGRSSSPRVLGWGCCLT